MEHIDSNPIEEAKPAKGAKKNAWAKRIAMAACLCLVAVGAFAASGLIGARNVEQPPVRQGFFNAAVITVEDETITVECIKSLQSNIPVGSKVQISADTVSSEPVPKMEVGDTVRVLYIGTTTKGSTAVLNTISIFLLDEKGEPIVQSAE